jgi:hypothetical protein
LAKGKDWCVLSVSGESRVYFLGLGGGLLNNKLIVLLDT